MKIKVFGKVCGLFSRTFCSFEFMLFHYSCISQLFPVRIFSEPIGKVIFRWDTRDGDYGDHNVASFAGFFQRSRISHLVPSKCFSCITNCIRRHGINFKMFFNFHSASETINNIKIITRMKKYGINLNTFKRRRFFCEILLTSMDLLPPAHGAYLENGFGVHCYSEIHSRAREKVKLDFSLGIKTNSL